MPKEPDRLEDCRGTIYVNRKLTAKAYIGGWYINLYNVTFTKRQIKNYKKYFNIDIENIKDK